MPGLLGLAAFSWISLAHAEDLKMESGRVYRDATISGVDGDGLIIRHKFGIVRVPFQNIAAESRQAFNPQKAAEQAENTRRQEQDRLRERKQEIGNGSRAESGETRRSVMAFEEDSEAEAEAFAGRIHHTAKPKEVPSRSFETFHVRGQVVAAGPTGYIVRCGAGRARDFDFFDQNLIFVTSDISEFVPGDYMDVRASAAGEETTFRTYLGEVYPGRFPIYRIIRDRRPEICIGFIWYGASLTGIVR
ncbi:MAG TPA: hypothetical protein VJ719_16300 [Chthoniobacterales bacterium]|nr:hypothetical protein [Chthoniobacterales bacterium]